ncbi:MAG: hypothetical protein C0410_10745 [Anaerolinea sp.]|nr:hypothetical protein [Anaerolinea sp.]
MPINFRLFTAVIILLFTISGCNTVETPEVAFIDSENAYLGQTPPGLTPQLFAPGIVSTDSTIEFGTAFSTDGTEIFFSQRVEGGQNKIYETHFLDGSWSNPTPISLSTKLEACEPHITADNKTLYFSVFIQESSNIWAMDRTTDGWSEPRLVGEGMFVSTDQNGTIYVTNFSSGYPSLSEVTLVDNVFKDYTYIAQGVHPAIAPDGSYLVSDNGDGSFKVRFRKEDGKWGTPKDLTKSGIPVTASIGSITPDGKYFFYVDKYDIYWVSTEVITSLK